MRKFVLLFILLAAFATSYLLVRVVGEREAEPPFLKVSGNIETTEVDVSFKVAGRISEIRVKEGDRVEKGQVIAKLEDEELRQRVEVSKAALKASQARLDKLLAGSRPEEIREAEANLQQAQFDFEYKRNQYERMKTLFESRVIPKETLDQAETRFKVAKAVLEGAQEFYKKVKEGPRKEDIEDGRAQVEQALASLRLAETQLGYALLKSPIDGIVLVKSAEAGEHVNPGTSVLTLADLSHVWLRAYIPETELGRVKWGQEVIVTTDLNPKKEYRGRISFISSQSEFTPKQIQTEKERVTLVYRIKVDLPNPEHELKPGMPAEGRILLTGSGPGSR
ncbi:MAG: efflux RND transporter periplasmic adaptor subunit [Desulfobacterota bacterium]|nr:efflux RND transporter periplasmic adaptor subunit [Thermodesulfobacteriota bacterium]